MTKPLRMKGFRRRLSATVRSSQLMQRVEAAGIAPASRDPSTLASTCVVARLIVGVGAPSGRVPFGLSRHGFNPDLNRRFGPDDPALASSGEASGRRPAAKPLGSAVRQPYGERESSRQINFGRLFTWPADQPRHAAQRVRNPVDPGSPPNCQGTGSGSTRSSPPLLSPEASRGQPLSSGREHTMIRPARKSPR